MIVALGGGITAHGQPRPATVTRARRAVALYRSGRAHRIVMSGAYGMYDPQPPRAEAIVMAQIAIAAGVPQDDLSVEAQSRDTIGNLWFTKPLLYQHGWHRVIVVMPTTQATRARLRIGRCYPGRVLEVGVTPPGLWAWVRGIVYEWPSLLKALVLQPSC